MFYLYNIRFFILFLFLVFITNSCKKEEDFANEQDAQIIAYLQSENIENYIKDNNTGIYYYFSNLPNNITPTKDSEIEVRVEGKLLDGTIFFPSNIIKVKLRETIIGWQLILPLFTLGSSGAVIIPSRFAYGKDGLENIIPSHAVVIFNIEELINIHPFF